MAGASRAAVAGGCGSRSGSLMAVALAARKSASLLLEFARPPVERVSFGLGDAAVLASCARLKQQGAGSDGQQGRGNRQDRRPEQDRRVERRGAAASGSMPARSTTGTKLRANVTRSRRRGDDK